MNLTNEFDPIREWATAKGILGKGDVNTQTLKLVEEVGELAKAVIERKQYHTIDAIGDCIVVLTSIAFFTGFKIEDCINKAYAEIANRTGKMENGTFIRDKKPWE